MKKAYWTVMENMKKMSQMHNDLSEARKKCEATHKIMIETIVPNKPVEMPLNNYQMPSNNYPQNQRKTRVSFALNSIQQQGQNPGFR